MKEMFKTVNIDYEWAVLILEAKNMGMTKDEVRILLETIKKLP